MKKHFVIALGLSSLLASSTALAQEASVTDEEPSVSSFATMDRGDASTKLGLNASMTFLDSDQSTSALRFDLHGQYVHKKGFGVYGSLPITHYSADGNPTGGGSDFSEMALGNLEVGGIYNHKLSDKLLLTARGGVMLPTADDDEGVWSNLANVLPRLTDLPSMYSDTTTLRASASLSGKEGQFFYRADAGFDIPVDTPEMTELDPLMRVNVGVGVNAGPLAIMGEFASVGTTGDVDDGVDRFLHTAAITAAFTKNKQIKPTISVIVPINDDITQMFDASVMLGLQGRLP